MKEYNALKNVLNNIIKEAGTDLAFDARALKIDTVIRDIIEPEIDKLNLSIDEMAGVETVVDKFTYVTFIYDEIRKEFEKLSGETRPANSKADMEGLKMLVHEVNVKLELLTEKLIGAGYL